MLLLLRLLLLGWGCCWGCCWGYCPHDRHCPRFPPPQFVQDGGYMVLVYLSGTLAAVDVAAISSMFSVWGVLWAFYWGMGLALQIRVGFHLGAGHPERAQAVAKLSVGVVLVLIGALSTGCYLLRFELPKLFSNDPTLIATVAESMWMLCFDYFLTCVQLCAENILEGMAVNTWVAVVQGIGSWALHVPLTVYLMLYCPAFASEPATAFFLGSAVSGTFKGVAMWFMVAKIDWRKQSDLAIKRSEAEASEIEKTIGDDDDDKESGEPPGEGGGGSRKRRRRRSSSSSSSQ